MSTPHRTLCMLSLLLALLAYSSCQSFSVEDLESGTTSETLSTVRILTRAADKGELSYPLHIYGFSDEGKLVAYQQLHTPDETLSLSLPQGQACHLVALSADADHYQLPAAPLLSSLITMTTLQSSSSLAQGFTSDSPLQLGSADVLPQTGNATVSIQLHYQVASLDVLFQGLPEACTSVYLSVASTYSGLSLDGKGSGSQTTRIPLTRTTTPGEWSASGIYVFPTQGKTTFTIAYNNAEGEQYSSVSYQAPLRPGTPYQLRGTYSDNSFLVTGAVTPSTWASPQVLNFTFHSSSSSTIDADPSDPSVPSDDVISLDTLPQSLTLWNGHFVAGYLDAEGNPVRSLSSLSASSSSVELLLLSITDKDGLTSALNESTPTAAADFAATYSEYDLSAEWRIPTDTEARYLSDLYRNNSEDFDRTLTDAGADPIVLTDSKGENLRYLCQDARKTYSFKNSTISNAGATVKTYHLRLVRTLPITIKDPQL